MSLTLEGARLTQEHRAAQAARGAFVAAAGEKLWLRTVKPDQLERTVTLWMRLMLQLIQRERKKSTQLTRKYYPEFRRLELPGGPKFVLPAPIDVDANRVITSLRVTGPIGFQKKITEIQQLDMDVVLQKSLLEETFEVAAKTSAASAVRHTLDGGRDMMRAAASQDPVALGWARVTDADPCFFCALLASRGFTYGKDAFESSNSLFTGDGPAKVHDGCQCTMEPSFKRGSEYPGRGREFEALWAQVTDENGVGGKEAIRAFRAAMEGREFKPRRRR